MESWQACQTVPVTYDEKFWPVVHVVMPATLSDAELDAHHKRLADYMNRGGLMSFVVDSRLMEPLSPDARRRTAEFIKTNEELAKNSVVAVALVHSSIVQTHILTAILWIVKPPVLIKVFSDVKQAEIWAREKMLGRTV